MVFLEEVWSSWRGCGLPRGGVVSSHLVPESVSESGRVAADVADVLLG